MAILKDIKILRIVSFDNYSFHFPSAFLPNLACITFIVGYPSVFCKPLLLVLNLTFLKLVLKVIDLSAAMV